ncbi:aminotransferase [Mycobacteroides abscessus subsp. abscessus]|nr:aminotransferase [Mycobacteroides abscessus subsp. abscessus]
MNQRTVERLRPFGATIFAEMSALAVRHDAINLGQGFPDEDGPASMLEASASSNPDPRSS